MPQDEVSDKYQPVTPHMSVQFSDIVMYLTLTNFYKNIYWKQLIAAWNT
jgi:hypothetical protein